MRSALAVLVVAALAGSCQVRRTDQVQVSTDTTATPAPIETPAPAPDRITWVVRPRGAGPLVIGMTAKDAGEALGFAIPNEAWAAGCHQIVSDGTPSGARLMFEDGRLVRIDIELPGLATDRGARVGMTEQEVQGLYGDSLRVVPHKYDPTGRYLVHSPDGASSATGFRTIFETDGRKVLRYRVGQEPQVEYVEGCS